MSRPERREHRRPASRNRRLAASARSHRRRDRCPLRSSTQRRLSQDRGCQRAGGRARRKKGDRGNLRCGARVDKDGAGAGSRAAGDRGVAYSAGRPLAHSSGYPGQGGRSARLSHGPSPARHAGGAHLAGRSCACADRFHRHFGRGRIAGRRGGRDGQRHQGSEWLRHRRAGPAGAVCRQSPLCRRRRRGGGGNRRGDRRPRAGIDPCRLRAACNRRRHGGRARARRSRRPCVRQSSARAAFLPRRYRCDVGAMRSHHRGHLHHAASDARFHGDGRGLRRAGGRRHVVGVCRRTARRPRPHAALAHPGSSRATHPGRDQPDRGRVRG